MTNLPNTSFFKVEPPHPPLNPPPLYRSLLPPYRIFHNTYSSGVELDTWQSSLLTVPLLPYSFRKILSVCEASLNLP